jgi:uncharacterized membrane protein
VNQVQQAPISPVNVAADLTVADLRAALTAGWRDFLTHPFYGLFFGAIYVAGGLALTYALFSRGASGWLLTAATGFPLVAPFTAVGLY